MHSQTHSIQISDPNIEMFSLQHDHKNQDTQTTHMSIDNKDKKMHYEHEMEHDPMFFQVKNWACNPSYSGG